MTKTLLKFDDLSMKALGKIAESGMDFSIVSGDVQKFEETLTFIVRGNGFASPVEGPKGCPEIYSLEDVINGCLLPDTEDEILIVSVKNLKQQERITLPPGYVGSWGAHQLLGNVTLKYPTSFFRYTSTKDDGHYSSGQIEKDTYLTTSSDQFFVNSGFGVVGRYALPSSNSSLI